MQQTVSWFSQDHGLTELSFRLGPRGLAAPQDHDRLHNLLYQCGRFAVRLNLCNVFLVQRL